MIIPNIESFLEYYERVRERTRKLVLLLPSQHLEWTYREGRFTLGAQVRHIAAIERWLYAENAAGRPSKYAGCGPELTAGYDSILDYFDEMHRQSVDIFQQLSPERLQSKIQTPAGTSITCWKWLRALAEHEIHHRGQIYLYLNMLDIKTPPIYGLTAEQLEASGKLA